MSEILVVEDDAALARGLKDNLVFEGHAVRVASSGEDALKQLTRANADLVVLDLMLPGISGFDVLRKLPETQRRPRVLVLSARDAETDVVRALDLGAHDYVKKPFGLAELLARVRAQLREAAGAAPASEVDARFADVRVSFARYRLWKGDREHLLSHHEVGLPRLFLARPDQPLKRAEILDQAWGVDAYPSERTIDNFVVKLRKKIEDDPEAPRFIRTVHGIGYRFVPDGRPDASA